MAYNCIVRADSISPDNVRLTTLECTYPRFVHSELLTHKMFSRSSASSRAIPVTRRHPESPPGMLERVLEDPVVPVWWGKNQSGMQAREELGEPARSLAIKDWLEARDGAVARARSLHALDVHKQIVNRLTEPWMWITVIVTATEWSNWDALRCHPDAEPHLRQIAELMRLTRAASEPRVVDYDEWHLPFVDQGEAFDMEVQNASEPDPKLVPVKVSAGRCARVSYLTHDGKREPAADVELGSRLRSSGHMAPLEHPARPMTTWEQEVYRRYEVRDEGAPMQRWEIDVFERHQASMRKPLAQATSLNRHRHLIGQAQSLYPEKRIIDCGAWCANFCGWIQYRKTIPGESDFGLLQQARQ